MAGERRLRILARLRVSETSQLDPSQPDTSSLCQVSAAVTQMSGAGIMLMSGDTPQGSICTTGGVSDLIERLQYELGEGPCVDAYKQDRPVLEPDLEHPATPRWLGFSGPACGAGVRAVFGFPLRVGAVRLGALNLYRDTPGRLGDDQHADALVMSEIAAETILLLQADAPPGMLSAALQEGSDFHFAVHQAAGMVAAQLGVSIGQALVRLRAHAFGNNRVLAEVAAEVVNRTLRFDAQSGEQDLSP